MRLVSLLPSATEIACALGLGDRLVGRSHECDWPPEVVALPALTSTKLEKGLGSRAIDDRVQAIVGQGLSVYAVDAERLRALRPDVILTQTQCAVCAVTPDDLTGALSDWTGAEPTIMSLAPDTLDDIWGDFARVAEAAGVPERAGPVVDALKARLEAVRSAVGDGGRPRVAAIEWIDPPMAAGNWVPELVGAAGGEPLFAAAGQHSPWLDWEALVAADPDAIVFMPCGFRLPQTFADLPALTGRAEWAGLRAVREGRVAAADGQYFFNRPGPRLIESAEILAEILHPGRVDFGHRGKAWVPVA